MSNIEKGNQEHVLLINEEDTENEYSGERTNEPGPGTTDGEKNFRIRQRNEGDGTLIQTDDNTVWSLLFWLLLLASLAILCLGIALQVNQHGSTLLIIGVIMVFLSYICYMRFNLRSTNEQYLKNICEQEGVPTLIEKLKSTAPVIRMTIECFHYNSENVGDNTKTKDQSDSEFEIPEPESESRKVITHTAEKIFTIDSWTDTSPSLDPSSIQKYYMAKLKIKKRIYFADEATRDCFAFEERSFLEQNIPRDQLYRYKCFFEIPGYQAKSLCIVNKENRPFILSHAVYIFFTIICCNFPYTLWFNKSTTKVVYNLTKLVKKNPLTVNQPIITPNAQTSELQSHSEYEMKSL